MRSFAFLYLLLTSLHSTTAGTLRDQQRDRTVSYATIINFNADDLLKGEDGLDPNPINPLIYGKPVWRTDTDGNGLVEHSSHVIYAETEAKYYLYSEAWGCGRILLFSGAIPGSSLPEGYSSANYPKGDNGGFCGFKVYSSDDITNWQFELDYYPLNFTETITKPRVIFSKASRKYVMWFISGHGLSTTGKFWTTTSDTPSGPWSEPVISPGPSLSHDYGITFDDEGTGWIITDPFANKTDPRWPTAGLPLWDIVVQKLNNDLTAPEGNQTFVMYASDWEALGFTYRNGWFYITSGITCSNCPGMIRSLRSRSPYGPWQTNDGLTDAESLHAGDIVSTDGCGAQNKGAAVLPSPEGPVYIAWAWNYRTSASNYILNGTNMHGDNSQAISSTQWYLQNWDEQDRLLPYTCDTSIEIPLMTAQKRQPQASAYQPECRVRPGSVLVQEFQLPPDHGRDIRFPVFQRTDDLGPYLQDGTVLNGPLIVEMRYKTKQEFLIFPAQNISHEPEVVSIPILEHVGLESISLSTSATNGCFGVLVEHQDGLGVYGLDVNGTFNRATAAQMYIVDN